MQITNDEDKLLEEETRILPMPDGSTYPLTAMKIYWGSYDFLIEEVGFSPGRDC